MAASSSQAPSLRHGEIIETSTTGFVAESDRLHHLPELGELVRARINDQLVQFAVVSYGATGAIDSSRRAVRRGTPESEDQDVYSRHPQLDHILRTIFHSAAVGYESPMGVRHSLPPIPAPLHYGVQPCSPGEIERFCRTPDYLASLVAFQGEVNPIQLVGAHLRWIDSRLDDDHVWLQSASRTLARLMRREYDQLVQILESIDPGR